MTREQEKAYLASGPAARADPGLPAKTGLLRVWKALCEARLPLVVHCPLDLFFMLAAFEQRPLPRTSPREFALLVRRCFSLVYDTAYLHSLFRSFRRLGLTKFYEDARAKY